MLFSPFVVFLSFALHTTLTTSIPCPPPQSTLASPSSSSSFSSFDDDDCPQVHIITVRGTIEEPGFGRMGSLVSQLLTQILGSDAYALVYPAQGIVKEPPSVNIAAYIQSEQTGVDALSAHMIDYADLCPETKVVLMGYSQGAQVVGDVLCGRAGNFGPFSKLQSIDPKYTTQVKAVVQLGDPSNRRAVNLPWHAGTSVNQGCFPRADISNCTYLGGNWQSWCDKGDPFCAIGFQGAVHLSYVEKYNSTIVGYVVDKVCGEEGCASSKEHVTGSIEL